MHAWYYNPSLGRLLSVDPLFGDPLRSQTLNRYAYVVDNPMNDVDPLGFEPVDVCSDKGACWGSLAVTANDPARELAERMWARMMWTSYARDRYGNLDIQFDGAISSAVEDDIYLQTLSDEALGAGMFADTGPNVVLAYDLFGPQVAGALDSIESTGGSPLDFLLFAGVGGLARGTAVSAARTTPRNLAEKLVLDEAKAGAGKRIMKGKIKDMMYPEALWAKMRHKHFHPGGSKTVIHYWQHIPTGARHGFKFK